MSHFVTDSLRALADAFSVPLILAVGLIVLAGLVRTLASLRFVIRHRGSRPLVVQVEYGKAALEGGEDYGVLDARLLSYLAADGPGSYVTAPGAGGTAAPGVPAEAPQPSAALVRLAFPKEPAFRVDVTWPGRVIPDDRLRATVRISRMPGNRIVASRSFTEGSTDELVEAIGSFCVTFLLSQPRILNHTPRWERWSRDVNGYRAYRRGLEHERNAETTFAVQEYLEALDCFHRAARIDPANMLLQLHRASLLELLNYHPEAVSIYKKCRTLWPEHIEVAYRLGNAHKSDRSQVELEELLQPLKDIKEQLRLSRIIRAWQRTWRPDRWNPGERRYWWSWISLRPWNRISKRTAYLHAVAISELLAELSFLLPQRNKPANTSPKEDVTQLMDRLARVLLRPHGMPATDRLLRPERLTGASEADPSLTPDPSYIPVYHGPHSYRRNMGWLALFNTACFFSLAIWIPKEAIPDGFTSEEWRDCCARASIRALGKIHRDPLHQLDPNWLATDPDLEPLLGTEIGRLWQVFVGLPQPEIDPPESS